MRAREARRTVLLPARLHADAGWSDARVHNLSSQGALVAANDAPARGSYVDLRVGPHTLIGRVAWRKERFFGIRLQGRIDVDAVAGTPGVRPRHAADGSEVERRAQARLAEEVAAARRIQRGQNIVRAVHMSLTLGCVVAASLVAAVAVHDLLAGPFAAIRGALGGG